MSELNLSKATAFEEVRRRMPWMFFALLAGIVMVLVGRMFEERLSNRLELALFLPMIVYMSDCIGTETLALFVRELSRHKVSLHRLLWREAAVGLSLGSATGIPMGLFAYLWKQEAKLAFTVMFAMAVNGLVAVLMGAAAPVLFSKLKRDPAIGSEEITTAISDISSLAIYLAVATLILF